MGSVFGGGGGGGGPAPDTSTQFIREAPGIEERKLELMDIARQTAQSPISIPDIQVQGLSPLEQAAITQAGQTGIGAGTVQQGIGSIQGAQQTAALDPTSTQFQNYFNPYQSFITDEINRQAQMQQNQIANEAVMGGAFGGGREGVQRAELGGRTLSAIGQAQGNAFQNALNAFQQNQALQTQAGLQGGVQLGTLGQLQQEMAGTDIARQLTAGGLERQIAQAQLDAYRQTQLQRSAEPLQRLEFLSNIYAAGPKSTSGITAATLPQSSPLAQSIGTGLGVAQVYQGMQNPAKFNEGGIVNALKVKKYQTGGSVSNDDDDESADILNDEVGAIPQYISPEQRRNLMLRPLTSQLLQATRRPGQSEASAVAGALGRGLEGQQDTALELTKYDAAVQAAKEKAKGAKAEVPSAFGVITGADLGTGDPDDEYFGEIDAYGRVVGKPEKTYDISEEKAQITKTFKDRALDKSDRALRQIETYIASLAKEGGIGNLPGVGPAGGRTPGIFTSAQGKKLRSLIAGFSNLRLRERSGAAVTESELNRFMEELAGGSTATNEAVLLSALGDARAALEKEKLDVLAGFGNTKAVKRYLEDEAISFYTVPKAMEMRIGSANLPRPEVEGLNFIERDGEQLTFIGGMPYKIDSKSNQLVRVKPRKTGK
jgi:hypothetical protein